MEVSLSSLTRCIAVFLLLLATHAHAFYIPGWSVKTYKDNEKTPLMVNKVYSDNTQLQYAYYDLPFVCPPSGQEKAGGLFSGQNIALNLGEVLRGDRIAASDYDIAMRQDKECQFLCQKEISLGDMNRAKELIRDGYVVEWIVDNLPGATSFVSVDKTRKYYAAGFKLGNIDLSTDTPRYYLNNHHTIVVRYRNGPGKDADSGGKVIVGFEVYPKSIGPKVKRNPDGCPMDIKNIDDGFELVMPPKSEEPRNKWGTNVVEDENAKLVVPYTYSVYYREDNSVEWHRRWDMYFVNAEEGTKIHWLAIINSLIICGMLTAIVLVILVRTIRTDLHKTSKIEDGKRGGIPKEKSAGLLDQPGAADLDLDATDEALEDATGWKLLHADVFRTPRMGYLLAPLVGSGMQLLFMSIGLVFLSAVGVLNPSYRGGFISFAIGLFVLAGLVSGYYSARVYKTCEGQFWRRNMLVTALFFPGLVFGVVFIINLFVWAQASSTAIPFTTLSAILFLWLCIQLPLVYIGSWYGYMRVGAWDYATKTASIPRQIPRQAWYLQSIRTVLLAGLIPFAVIFIELLFVFQSVWQDKSGYYYVFGFLAVVLTILVVTVAEVTVVTVYVQLCAENHEWWWQSFMIGGGSALWVFLYCLWYYTFKLHITGFVSSLLFFTYSFLACCIYGLLTGTVGFLSAFAFVRRIYGAIKID